jgi:hypothetical protein
LQAPVCGLSSSFLRAAEVLWRKRQQRPYAPAARVSFSVGSRLQLMCWIHHPSLHPTAQWPRGRLTGTGAAESKGKASMTCMQYEQKLPDSCSRCGPREPRWGDDVGACASQKRQLNEYRRCQ